MDKQKILIADHDSRVLSTLTEFLSDEPYEIFKAEKGTEGLKVLRREKIALAIVEKHIAGLGGITFLETVKAQKIQTTILIMGGIEHMESTEKILKMGAVSVLNKPIIKGNFLAKIKAFMPPNDGMNWSENSQSGSNDSPSCPVPLQASQDKWKTDLESFLNEHYHEPDLEFNALMCYFDLSRSHGCALFRKHFDKPFREILREVRVEQVERFLEESSLRVNEIAHLCGFHSSDRLRVDFKKIHGISPTLYRKKVISGENPGRSGRFRR